MSEAARYYRHPATGDATMELTTTDDDGTAAVSNPMPRGSLEITESEYLVAAAEAASIIM